MKSIRANFNKENKDQFLSSFVVLTKAIRGKRYSRESILKNFNNLVDKDDYSESDKKALVDYLYSLSNPLRNGK